jgi:hypothetical protein
MPLGADIDIEVDSITFRIDASSNEIFIAKGKSLGSLPEGCELSESVDPRLQMVNMPMLPVSEMHSLLHDGFSGCRVPDG